MAEIEDQKTQPEEAVKHLEDNPTSQALQECQIVLPLARYRVAMHVHGERGGTTGALDQEITEREEGKETMGVLRTRTDTQIHRNYNYL